MVYSQIDLLRYIAEVRYIYSATCEQRNIQLIKMQLINKCANKGAIVIPWVGFTTSAVRTILDIFFFREDDLLTCKKLTKTKQNNNIRAHGKKLITFPLH